MLDSRPARQQEAHRGPLSYQGHQHYRVDDNRQRVALWGRQRETQRQRDGERAAQPGEQQQRTPIPWNRRGELPAMWSRPRAPASKRVLQRQQEIDHERAPDDDAYHRPDDGTDRRGEIRLADLDTEQQEEEAVGDEADELPDQVHCLDSVLR